MKPKDYVRIFRLDESGRLTDEFWGQFLLDFSGLLETGDGMSNIKGFENAVRALRSKWEGIRMKSGKVSEKGWNYFFATKIAPMREELFPKEMTRRKNEKEDRTRRRQEQRAWEEDFFEESRRGFFKFLQDGLLALLGLGRYKTAFQELGLDIETATEDDVKSIYRQAAKEHHPDRGGNRVRFEKFTEAKNLALAYLSKTKE